MFRTGESRGARYLSKHLRGGLEDCGLAGARATDLDADDAEWQAYKGGVVREDRGCYAHLPVLAAVGGAQPQRRARSHCAFLVRRERRWGLVAVLNTV